MDVSFFDQRILPTYRRYPIQILHAEGSRVTDENGREYIDMFPGFGAGNVGHRHPRVLEAVRRQLDQVIHVPNVYYSPVMAELADQIIRHSGPARVFLCNSGTEANEAAIKFARRSRPGRTEIVTLQNSFHGRTMGSLSATGQASLQQGFEPLVPGFRHCRINDIEHLNELVNSSTAAILLEAVQGEGGIRPLNPDFVIAARELCDRSGALLIFDEVQTGMGRTGKMFACQNYPVQADLICLAKSLGGGLPIGALLVGDHIENALTPGSHGSTFGGNALACAAGIAVFEVIEEENLLEKAVESGEILKNFFYSLKDKCEHIAEVRSVGLMLGVELKSPCSELVDRYRERGILLNCTQSTVLRIMPALNISPGDIQQFMQISESLLT